MCLPVTCVSVQVHIAKSSALLFSFGGICPSKEKNNMYRKKKLPKLHKKTGTFSSGKKNKKWENGEATQTTRESTEQRRQELLSFFLSQGQKGAYKTKCSYQVFKSLRPCFCGHLKA